MKKTFKSISLFLIMVLALAGCTPAGTSTTAAGTGASTTAASTVAATTTGKDTSAQEATVYPMKFKNPNGTEVTIEKEPKKIVSLSPTFTEVIYAIGKGDLLKGRTDFCDFPKEVSNVPSVGSMSNPSIEKIVELEPDVVIVSFLKDEVVKKIETAGAKVIVLPSGDSLKGSYNNMLNIGKVLNANTKAKELTSSIEKEIAQVSEKVKGAKSVTAYYVAGFGKTGDYTAGKGTFINELINAAGGDNVAVDAEGWKYTSEKLMEKDPSLVFMGAMTKLAEEFKTTEPYKNLSAVKNKKVFEIEDSLIAREGPRMAEGVKLLAKLFHPTLFN